MGNLKDDEVKRKSSPCDKSEFENIESLNNARIIDKSRIDKKTQATQCNHSQISPQHCRKLDKSLKDFTKSNRSLKRPLDNDTLTKDVLRTPKAFINFEDDSGLSNMPVILNVFTLSQIPATHIRQKKANKILENSFPVTPPCSPPLLRHEQMSHTGTSNIETVFSSDHGFTKPTFNKSTLESKLHSNNYCIGRGQQNVNHVIHTISPAAVSQMICQRDIPIEKETKRRRNNGDNIRLSEAKVENNFIPFPSRSVTTGNLKIQENKLSTGRTSGKLRVGPEYPDQKVFSELLQDIEIQRLGGSETSSRSSLEPKNIENGRLGDLSTCNNNAVFFGNLESPLVGHQIQNDHKLKPFSPATSGSRNYVTGDHLYLSPRDIKVIQLKKKLQEQEAVLKQLRKYH